MVRTVDTIHTGKLYGVEPRSSCRNAAKEQRYGRGGKTNKRTTGTRLYSNIDSLAGSFIQCLLAALRESRRRVYPSFGSIPSTSLVGTNRLQPPDSITPLSLDSVPRLPPESSFCHTSLRCLSSGCIIFKHHYLASHGTALHAPDMLRLRAGYLHRSVRRQLPEPWCLIMAGSVAGTSGTLNSSLMAPPTPASISIGAISFDRTEWHPYVAIKTQRWEINYLPITFYFPCHQNVTS